MTTSTPRKNRSHIKKIAASAPTALDGLALLFEDDGIIDDGSVLGRVWAIFKATERVLIPGLQTAILFDDSGFAGDRKLGGAGFKDPWWTSRNQPGHFLTAVRLRLDPEVVRRPIPVLGSIRRIVHAPATLPDLDVALRLAIGHEKYRDPSDALPAIAAVLQAGLSAYRQLYAVDLSRIDRLSGVAAAAATESIVQAQGILGAFRAQFEATMDADIAAWHDALRRAGTETHFNRAAVEGPDNPLDKITVAGDVGNSVQDLRLTLAGWHLGDLIARDAFRDRQAIGRWLRTALGN